MTTLQTLLLECCKEKIDEFLEKFQTPPLPPHFGGCLEPVWGVCGGCPRVSEGCLVRCLGLSGGCLGDVSTDVWGYLRDVSTDVYGYLRYA